MLVDSWYDPYLGVVVLVRIQDGKLKKGEKIRMIKTGATYNVDRVAVLTPEMEDIDCLGPGEIGVITASIDPLLPKKLRSIIPSLRED